MDERCLPLIVVFLSLGLFHIIGFSQAFDDFEFDLPNNADYKRCFSQAFKLRSSGMTIFDIHHKLKLSKEIKPRRVNGLGTNRTIDDMLKQEEADKLKRRLACILALDEVAMLEVSGPPDTEFNVKIINFVGNNAQELNLTS